MNIPKLLLHDCFPRFNYGTKNQTRPSLPDARNIANRFQLFHSEVPVLLAELHQTTEDLNNYVDLHNLVSNWVKVNRTV